jgi:hypothetical protein
MMFFVKQDFPGGMNVALGIKHYSGYMQSNPCSIRKSIVICFTLATNFYY